MYRSFSILLYLPFGFFLLLTFNACSSTSQNVKLNQSYNFSEKQLITSYIIPTGDKERDETYARVLHLDLQARGYKVIDANPILEEHSEKLTGSNHRQIVDTLQSKKYLPLSDLYVVVSAAWDSAYILTYYSEDKYVYWIQYQFSGMNVPTLTSRVSFFDRSIRDPIKSYTTSDTTYILSENNNAQFVYPEYPWIVIAKQLSRELSDIPICSIVDKSRAKIQFKVSFWVDNSYRKEFPNSWMDRLKLRTLYANDILRSQLNIELAQLEFNEWNTGFDRTLENSLEKLYQSTVSNPGALQIAITINKNLKQDWTDKSDLGLAYLLSNDAVITAQPSFPSVGQDWNSIEEAITLVHEIGHMLGAIHVPDVNSIMYPSAGSLKYEFDLVNKKIIDETKSNFLSENQKQRLVSYSTELVQIKDFPSLNSNPILPAISSVVQQINNRSQIITNNSEKTLSTLLTLVPDSATTFAVMGFLEFNDKQYESAINSFTKALEIDPDFAEAQYYLSQVFQKMGSTEDSDKYKNLAKPYSKLWIIEK